MLCQKAQDLIQLTRFDSNNGVKKQYIAFGTLPTKCDSQYDCLHIITAHLTRVIRTEKIKIKAVETYKSQTLLNTDHYYY